MSYTAEDRPDNGVMLTGIIDLYINPSFCFSPYGSEGENMNYKLS